MRRLGLLVAGLALLLAGCGVFVSRPAVDISGHWSGTWSGYGIGNIAREELAFADFTQRGAWGRGRLVFEGTPAADSVPPVIREAGATGSRVLFRVRGVTVVMTHENGAELLRVDFRVFGDRMIGHIPDTDPPVRIVLAREKLDALRSQAAAGAPPPAPSAPPPVAPTPEPAAPAPPPMGAEPAPPGSTSEPGAPGAGATPGAEATPGAGATPGAEPTGSARGSGTTRPAPQEFTAAPELGTVYFAFNRADITRSVAAILDLNAAWLKTNQILVLVEGHADERGTPEYNLALGERRAKAVRDYLVDRGVAGDRINTVSYGEQRPVCTEKHEDCWKRNRRAEFFVKSQ
jgi:peptidoglycan-associated lipoprotein